MSVYSRVRHACLVGGKSARKVSDEFGLNRRTVGKMLEHPVPPGYKRSQEAKKPKLGPQIEFIDEVLREDKRRPRKQRHTAKRIFKRLQEERGYEGGYTIVREYVSKARRRGQEMFCPLVHEAGEAQVDFGEALAIIGGEEVKIHFFVMDIPQSDGCFVKAYRREDTVSFCDGHVSAFEYFGGTPLRILYDNSKIAVSRILGDGRREKARGFCELQSYYLFEEKFARVGKGNDKGKVEGLVGYVRRNFMVPLPSFETFEALNEYLEGCCRKREKDLLRGHRETIGERLKRDQESFLPLPSVPYEACEHQGGRVSSQGLVRYCGNDYSVPSSYGHLDVLVRGYVGRVIISCGTKVIATHDRCYGKNELVLDPMHYLALLEQKTGALDQAAPLQNWDLPPSFEKLKGVLERKSGKEGKRDYVRVLRLLETFHVEEVEGGIKEALALGSPCLEVIKHLILCRLEKRPVSLDLKHWQDVPAVCVKATRAQDYSQLLGGAR